MAWLLIAVAVGVVGIAILWWRQHTRTPHTITDSITRFARARHALSPDARSRARPQSDIVVRPDRTRRHVTPVPPRPPSDDPRRRASDARAE